MGCSASATSVARQQEDHCYNASEVDNSSSSATTLATSMVFIAPPRVRGCPTAPSQDSLSSIPTVEIMVPAAKMVEPTATRDQAMAPTPEPVPALAQSRCSNPFTSNSVYEQTVGAEPMQMDGLCAEPEDPLWWMDFVEGSETEFEVDPTELEFPPLDHQQQCDLNVWRSEVAQHFC